MQRPFRLKWKWSLLVALGVWALSVVGYLVLSVVCRDGRFVCRQDVSFVQTLIFPAMALVGLAPFSLPKFIYSKWLIPGMAAWLAVTMPGVYLVGRLFTALGNHCDKTAILAGVAVFFVLNLFWVIARWQGWVPLEQERSVDSQVRVASPTRGDATPETVLPVF